MSPCLTCAVGLQQKTPMNSALYNPLSLRMLGEHSAPSLDLMTNALTYEDALVASTRGPSLATHVALLRARQLVGGQTFSLFGAVDAVECFSLDAHGASNGVRLVGHMHGKAWPFLALRPSCREFCRELVLHFETPMLFLGPASDNATILVHAGFDELIGSFRCGADLPKALARAF
ncbi:MAG: hypothetical protein IPM79_04305 [Polyangiaceae bacterium]|nr:hypothetical protein [Polyangiaceae bacterium]